MNIGDGIAVGELQGRVLFEKRDHVRRRSEEGVDHCRVVMLAEFMAQVSARLLDVFDDACAPGQRIARHPRPATGPGGGTAEYRVFFDDDDFQAVPRRRDRRRQAGSAGADDQHVAVNIGKFGRHQVKLRRLIFIGI